jgi:DNA-binding HxlR family transcriptional regulator
MAHAALPASADDVALQFDKFRDGRAHQKDRLHVGKRSPQTFLLCKVCDHGSHAGRSFARVFLVAVHRSKWPAALAHFIKDSSANCSGSSSNNNHDFPLVGSAQTGAACFEAGRAGLELSQAWYKGSALRESTHFFVSDSTSGAADFRFVSSPGGRMKDHHGCPVQATINVLSGKWKVQILWHLSFGPRRFAELRKKLSKISEKVLTDQLRQLERDGVLLRKVTPSIPPKVTYSLNAGGEKLVPHDGIAL